MLVSHERRRGGPFVPGIEILCNISKGQYLRGDTLRVGLDTESPATVYHALALRITWSCSADFAMPSHGWEDEVVHAPWAGDRFCLVTRMEMMPKLPKGMEWRDVTNEAQSLLEKVWDSLEVEKVGEPEP